MIGKLRAIDAGGAVGEPHPRFPWPDNLFINSAIDWAASEINREGDFDVSTTLIQVPVGIPDSTNLGPTRINLRNIGGLPFDFQINTVRRVSWLDNNSGSWTTLAPTTFQKLDRDKIEWLNDPPTIPNQWWAESYELWLRPPNQNPGTLAMLCGIGLAAPLNDSDTFLELPLDYYPNVLAKAILYLIAQQPHDEVMVQRFQMLWKGLADKAGTEVAQWYRRMDVPQQGSLTPDTNRAWWGRR